MHRGIWLAPLILAAGCAVNRTQIESSWIDPTFAEPGFERVAVLALFDTEAESRSFEDEAAQRLESLGVEAVVGRDILDPDVEHARDDLERALVGAGADAVLIFRLVAVDERRVYRRPTPYVRAMPPGVVWGDPFYWYYFPHWNYYWHWRSSWAVTRSPGYWAEYTYVTVESSLYDGESGRLVWTAKTETIDGDRFDRLVDSVAGEITAMLVDLDLLMPSDTALALAE